MHLPGLNDIICNHTIFPSPVTSPGVQVFSLFLKMLDTKPQKASKVTSTSLWDPFFPLLLNHRTAFRSSNRKDFVWFVKEPVDQTQTQALFLKLKIKSENSLHICSFFWQLPRYSFWASATITWRRKKKKLKQEVVEEEEFSSQLHFHVTCNLMKYLLPTQLIRAHPADYGNRKQCKKLIS